MSEQSVEELAEGLSEAQRRAPTHYCVICAARWTKWPDGSWSLASDKCGPCCDNAAMDEAPIVEILADGTVNGKAADQAKRKFRADERRSQVERYRGILCARCNEPFENHFDNWGCPHRTVPRFKFPVRAHLQENRREQG